MVLAACCTLTGLPFSDRDLPVLSDLFGPRPAAAQSAPALLAAIGLANQGFAIANLVCNADGTVASVDIVPIAGGPPVATGLTTSVAVAECPVAVPDDTGDGSAGNVDDADGAGGNGGLNGNEIANIGTHLGSSLGQDNEDIFGALEHLNNAGNVPLNVPDDGPPPVIVAEPENDNGQTAAAQPVVDQEPEALVPDNRISPQAEVILRQRRRLAEQLAELKRGIAALRARMLEADQKDGLTYEEKAELAFGLLVELGRLNEVEIQLNDQLDQTTRDLADLAKPKPPAVDEEETEEASGELTPEDQARRDQLDQEVAKHNAIIAKIRNDLARLNGRTITLDTGIDFKLAQQEAEKDYNLLFRIVNEINQSLARFLLADESDADPTKNLEELNERLAGVQQEIAKRKRDLADQISVRDAFQRQRDAISPRRDSLFYPSDRHRTARNPEQALVLAYTAGNSDRIWTSDRLTAPPAARPELLPTASQTLSVRLAQASTIPNGNTGSAASDRLIEDMKTLSATLQTIADQSGELIRQADEALGVDARRPPLLYRMILNGLPKQPLPVIRERLQDVLAANELAVGGMLARIDEAVAALRQAASRRSKRAARRAKRNGRRSFSNTYAARQRGSYGGRDGRQPRRSHLRQSDARGPVASHSRNGDEIGFSLDIDEAMRAVWRANGAGKLGIGAYGGDVLQDPLRGWNIWLSGSGTAFDDSQTAGRQGRQFQVSGGAAYQLTKVVAIGGQVTYKHGQSDSALLGSELEGNFVGGGVFARLDLYRGLLVDVAANYEHGFNNLSLPGDSGDYGSNSLNVGARISKRFALPRNWWLEPNAGVTYSTFTNGDYGTRNGVAVPSANSEQGRILFGPKLGHTFDLQDSYIDRGQIFAGVNGIIDFISSDAAGVGNGVVARDPGNGVQVSTGFNLAFGNGWTTSAAFSYTGLDTLDSFTGSLGVRIPVN